MKPTAVILAAMLTVVATSAAFANLLANGEFEGEYGADGVAPGWRDNSYSSKGPIDRVFSRETKNVRVGEACQRITCTRIGYISEERRGRAYHGAWQMLAEEDLPLRDGAIYRVRVSLRADRPVPVDVQLRMRPEPWTAYVSHTVLADHDWQDVDYLYDCRVDDPRAAFFVRSEYLGAVWVDAASVEELTREQAAQIAGPVTPGNLLHNGSFDLGRANWMGERGWDTIHDAEFTVEQVDGDPCLRATAAEGHRKAIRSDAVPVTRGHPIRVSCRVRAARTTEITLSARREAERFAMPEYCSTTVQVGDEWETVEAESVVPFLGGPAHAFVDVTFSGPGPVWVDDIVLRQDDGPDVPLTRAAIVADRHPWGLYFDGDPVTLRVMASVPEGHTPTLNWRLADYQGHVVREGRLEPDAGRTHLEVDVSDLPRGYYHAAVEWDSGGRALGNESTFAILPDPQRPPPAEPSFFGGHYQTSPVNTNLAEAVGTRWVRLWPPTLTVWRVIEPQKGQWRWRDAEVERLLDEGLVILGMLDHPPDWVKWRSDTYWDEWERYAATVVERYKGRIDAWEITNEPNLQWWWLESPEGNKRAEWYFEILKRLYAVVKRVNPQATVYGGAIGGDFSAGTDSLAFTEELIELGGLEFMDVLSFHRYHSYAVRMPLDEMPDPIEDSIARMRDTMRAAGREIPIVNSEGGTYNPGPAISYRPLQPGNYAPIPPAKVARLMVRQHVAQWAAGVDRFWYYNCFINGSPLARAWDSFIAGDGQPRPTVAAYAVMTWLLDGGEFIRTERPTDDIRLHHFHTHRGPLVVAWSRTGTEAGHTFPGARQAWDMMGREIALQEGRITLTPDPVYVLLAHRAPA